jgi:hypothetical protein
VKVWPASGTKDMLGFCELRESREQDEGNSIWYFVLYTKTPVLGCI